jgi:hypothetical protein
METISNFSDFCRVFRCVYVFNSNALVVVGVSQDNRWFFLPHPDQQKILPEYVMIKGLILIRTLRGGWKWIHECWLLT